MRHDNLAPYVQADHYRCFTGESGRIFLANHVKKDTRGLPERSRRKDVYIHNSKNEGTTKYTYLPENPEKITHLEMTIVAKEDASATVEIEYGGLFEINEVDTEEQEGNDKKE